MSKLDANYFFNDDVSNIKEDQKENHWIWTFTDGSFKNFNLYLETSSLPLFVTKSKRLDTTNVILPDGGENFRTLTVTFRETTDFQGFKYHKEWLDKLYDFETQTVKKTYHSAKRVAEIKFYSPLIETSGVTQSVKGTDLAGFSLDYGSYKQKNLNISNQGIRQNIVFKLYGIQFTGFDDVQLQNDSGGPLTISCNYEVERIEYDYTQSFMI